MGDAKPCTRMDFRVDSASRRPAGALAAPPLMRDPSRSGFSAVANRCKRFAGDGHSAPGARIGIRRQELDEVWLQDLRGERRAGAVAIELAPDGGHERLRSEEHTSELQYGLHLV